PPKDRDTDRWLGPRHMGVVYLVLLDDTALDGRRVDSILHHRRERRACHDGLPHHILSDSDELACRAQTRSDVVLIRTPVAATLDVVITGPDQLDRILAAGGLGDGDDFGNVVRLGVRAPAEGSAGSECVDEYLFRLEPARLRRVHLVDGLELTARPHFTS